MKFHLWMIFLESLEYCFTILIYLTIFQMPTFVFTEDFQKKFLEAYHRVFDEFRPRYLVGEMVWNFADFMTTESK